MARDVTFIEPRNAMELLRCPNLSQESEQPVLEGYREGEKWVWQYKGIKNFIKLTKEQGDFSYVQELIVYSKPKI